MFPASTTMTGTAMTTGPTDVCKTPTPAGPIPLPYPNIADLSMATGFAVNVFMAMKNVLNLGSQVPLSSGDEAGSAGGVVSGVIKGPCKFTAGSATVFIAALPCVRLTSATTQNGASANTVGMVTVPSQSTVIIAS